jgi:hypothetical protein
MTARGATWILTLACIVVFIVGSVLSPAPDVAASALFFGIATSLLLVGALLMTRVPGNRVGAMLLIAGVMLTAGASLLPTYSLLGAQAVPVWPGAAIAGVLADVFYIYPIVIVLIGVPLVFPDGRLPSVRFRWVAGVTIAAMAAVTIAGLFSPGESGLTGLANPLGMPTLVPVFDALNNFANLSAIFGFGGAAAALWVRFHRGDPIVREQLKWLLAVAAVATIAFPAAFLLQPSDPTQTNPVSDGMFLLGFIALLALPVAIGVAILRYRLYEIDRIISRTLAYLVLTAVLVGAYAGLVLVLGGPLGDATGGDTLSIALSTLAVAALFQPLRRRVQTLVDRRFDRARYDGQQLADAFAGRLRDDVDIDTVSADLDATVRAAVRPTTASLWVRGRDA